MKTLDRYVIRSFLFSALLWFLILMGIRIIADLTLNLDEFAKTQKPFWDHMSDIGTYYMYQSVIYFIELGGIIIVAAAAFTLAMMNHTNELTAMMASGISLRRVVMPIIICSVLLGGLIVLDQEYVIPPLADKLVRNKDEVPAKNDFPMYIAIDGNNAAWRSPQFHPQTDTMDKPVVLIRDHKNPTLIARIVGTSAQATMIGKERGWVFTGGELTKMDEPDNVWPRVPELARIPTKVGPEQVAAGGPQVDQQYGLTITYERTVQEQTPAGPATVLVKPQFRYQRPDGQVLGVYLADSARWSMPKENEGGWNLTGGRLFFPSDLTSNDIVLRQCSTWLDFMSTSDIARLLELDRIPDAEGAVLAKHLRFTEPISNLVKLLLALPFILSRERNIRASAGLCMLVVGVYVGATYLFRFIGLPPQLAAWLPILIFGPISVVMYDSVKT